LSVPIANACPVCGKPSYSLAKIHPQCAVLRADEPRTKLIAAEKKANATKPPSLRACEKLCPKCNSRLSAQQGMCPCGYAFHPKRW
jgi:hypothetical protein